jgi:hypothetical protein
VGYTGRRAAVVAASFGLLVGLALACYAPVLTAYFLSDDFCLVGQVAREGFFHGWTGFLRPATVLTYVVDHAIWGLDPVGYHLTNVLFHVLAACSVFFIARHFLRQTTAQRPDLLAFWAAALFVALPCHSESVSWIAGRTDPIAVALGLAATSCFLSMLEGRSYPLIRASAALTLFVGALLSKESILVLPGLWCAILVHHRWSRKEPASPLATGLIVASFVVLAGYFVLRKAIVGQFVGGYGTEAHLAILRVSSAANLARFALRTFLPPLPQAADPPGDFAAPLAVGVALAALSFVVVARRRRLQRPHLHMALLLAACYLISLVPALTLRVHMFDTQGERFLYLPSAFACVLAACVAAPIVTDARIGAIALAGFVAVEGAALHAVNDRWATAGLLSRRIAAEVAQSDPGTTEVLNVPDNFRGAYVFRTGLEDAATTFLARRTGTPYRVLSVHDVHSLQQVFDVREDGAATTLTLPADVSVWAPPSPGLELRGADAPFVVAYTPAAGRPARALLWFRTAAESPMFRTIDRRPR